MKDETIYHIYAKDRCLYPCLREEEFTKVWSDLQNMVGLMKTDYTVDDLSYVECPPDAAGGNRYDDNLEPSYQMYIQIYDNALDKEECESIIKYFNTSPNTHRGSTITGNDQFLLDESNKSSTDLTLYYSNWELPSQIFNPALRKGLDKYVSKFPFLKEINPWNIDNGYNIQKYTEGEGYFSIHCEHNAPYNTNRLLAWMFYLNNARCGTRFYYPKRDIRAKRGRLVIWPAFWTHPHSGITPNRGVKYIATGWFNFC